MNRTTAVGVVLATLLSTVLMEGGTRPRVFITDSSSWEVKASFSASDGEAFGNLRGGSRPQTVELIKTFGQRCPQTIVTMNSQRAHYVVLFDREGGKGLIRKDNKIEKDVVLKRCWRRKTNCQHQHRDDEDDAETERHDYLSSFAYSAPESHGIHDYNRAA